MSNRILLVDDDPLFTEQVAALLAKNDFAAEREHLSGRVLSRLQAALFDVVVLDIQMPAPDGLTLLQSIIKLENPPEVIICSGAASLQQAADSIKLGAADFLEKPPDVNRLLSVIKNACERHRLKMENLRFRKSRLEACRMVGQSSVMEELAHTIKRAAASPSRILIWGETGVGKELAAMQIHYLSERAAGPLIRVNCAAIPQELAESELFGHKRGAFTGAVVDRVGKFMAADGGTIVLDEIAELPLPLQSKLLRLLETSELEVLGLALPQKIDVRLVSISGKDLAKEVENGRFRADLFYRVNTISIRIPPLRERKEDIPLLVEHFFDGLREADGHSERTYDPEAVALLIAHDWPGNVRELKNVVERAYFLSSQAVISKEFFKSALTDEQPPSGQIDHGPSGRNLLSRAVDNFERNFLEANLRRVEGNISELARILGMDRGNLYKKLKHLGLL